MNLSSSVFWPGSIVFAEAFFFPSSTFTFTTSACFFGGMGFADLAFYDYSKEEPLLGLEKKKPGTGAPNYVTGLLVKTRASEMWARQKTHDFH